MNLKKYDNSLVRIIDIDDEVFEGFCTYDDAEYNECEYGHNEESLRILYFTFYKGVIKDVKKIKEFSDPYGTLEEMIIEDGLFFIEDVFFSEDNEHIYRMLLCLDKHLDSFDDSIFDLLSKQLNYNEDKKIQNEIKKLLKRRD